MTEEQLQAAIAALKLKLPVPLVKAVEAVIDTSFDCGAHGPDDDEPYETLHQRSIEADHNLFVELVHLVPPGRQLKATREWEIHDRAVSLEELEGDLRLLRRMKNVPMDLARDLEAKAKGLRAELIALEASA
jgi:hypothetical protein